MAAFIDSQVASGNWSLIDCFQFYAMDTAANAVIDWKGNSNGTLINSPTFDAYDFIQTNGSSSRIDSGFVPSADGVNFTQNDCLMGVYIISDDDDQANDYYAFGGVATAQLGVLYFQVANSLRYRVNASAVSTTAITSFNANKLYSIGRENSSAIQKLYEGSTQVDSEADASSGICSEEISIGCRNANATRKDFMAGKYVCYYAAAGNGNFDLADFNTNLNTLITNVAALG